ncbi:MAG: site-specific DNA-methyltransferase [Chloroflexi bacterium]|nr:MAG: site-specific DNA-methyltransferase [Chloroflexota bacterium]
MATYRTRKTRKPPAGPTPVEALRHGDKRKNIPTAELHDFMEKDEAAPPPILYPRDPSLDPQLVWKGKDEQDREDLAVPVVPIYIQEKIQPRAIIENVRAQARAGQPEQMNLFADFNGIEFEELIEFYQHEQNWSNRMILGDSLYVMASLAEKEGLKGKVQMIYVDPPYGIRFGSNWQVSTRKRDVKDGRAEDASREPEVVKAFRDTWELGVHSYLSYVRDRIRVAHGLLSETGSIFVQIGDENVHLVRSVIDEVFGSENFISLITVMKTSSATAELLAGVSDYLLLYAKQRGAMKYRQLFREKVQGGEGGEAYSWIQLPDGHRLSVREALQQGKTLSDGTYFRLSDMRSQRPPGDFPVEFQGRVIRPPTGYWKTGPEGFQKLIAADRIVLNGNTLNYVRFIDDFPAFPITNSWTDVSSSVGGVKVFVVQTGTTIVERCVLMTTDPGDLVLDPTCESGTTAYAAEQWGRRWITIDTSRVALALARTRLMSAKYRYYLLADSPEGIAREAEVTGQTQPEYKTEGDIKKGFVYKRVPHVTLKSIANNPNIKEGMAREEIDRAVKRHAETETLYDQPYEDNRRIRVSGPFTVESLSPHRVLSSDDGRPESEREGERGDTAGQFTVMIIDNLRKAGVQNRVKDERLVFDRLEPFAGTWIQADGEYADKSGKLVRVAVSIGPEHGTVGSEQVKEAAKEALRGAGFDILVVCGFAFDAHAGETAKEFSPDASKTREGFVAEEAKKYGKLPVLLAKMNPDLAMGDELLKKTGAGNLFMVFGEPDLTIEKSSDGKIVVEIRGVDVYDPTTGEIRSDSTADIACWFIDTNYNEESFFVRHAYFTGADEPYERLKRALRAEVDEGAWSTLYSTRSFPFDRPETGEIAVKVINHYGDEVLKVYEV